jgi:hypothetical protein
MNGRPVDLADSINSRLTDNAELASMCAAICDLLEGLPSDSGHHPDLDALWGGLRIVCQRLAADTWELSTDVTRLYSALVPDSISDVAPPGATTAERSKAERSKRKR